MATTDIETENDQQQNANGNNQRKVKQIEEEKGEAANYSNSNSIANSNGNSSTDSSEEQTDSDFGDFEPNFLKMTLNSSTSTSATSSTFTSPSSSSSSPSNLSRHQVDPETEPILSRKSRRYVLFPIQYPEIYRLAKVQTAGFWTIEEGDLSKDLDDLKKLSTGEKHFLFHVLAFFASADGIVMANIESNFADEVQISEARYYYSAQNFIESIHSEAYSLMIDTYVSDPVQKRSLFNAIENLPGVKKKAEWALKYMDRNTRSFAQRLIAFGCVEGIHFSGSFCAVFWFKKRGLLPGLGFYNEFIARDEGLHVKACVTLYSYLKHKLAAWEIHEIVKDAVDVECEFITQSLPVNLIGMNSDLMIEYIKFVADVYLDQLSVPRLYNTRNPFEFMENISLQGKTNFFERKVTEYQKAGVLTNPLDDVFTLDAEF